jgi:hypothetical protein
MWYTITRSVEFVNILCIGFKKIPFDLINYILRRITVRNLVISFVPLSLETRMKPWQTFEGKYKIQDWMLKLAL